MLDGCTPWPAEFAERYRAAGYWRGQTFGALLRELADRYGERTAVVGGTRRVSYAQLDVRADRLAAGLHALGIAAGDRVVVQLPNVPEFFSVVFALFRLGAAPVFALPSHRRSELAYFAEHSGAVALVVPDVHGGFDHRALAAEIAGSVPSVRHVLVAGEVGDGPGIALNEIGAEPLDLPDPDPGEVAFLQLSGGSTGLPKLIPRTHDDYLYSVRASADICELGEDTVYLCALPVAHNFPLSSPGVLGTLYAGGTVVLAPQPTPEVAFPLIAAERVTITALVPPLAIVWLDAAAAQRPAAPAPAQSAAEPAEPAAPAPAAPAEPAAPAAPAEPAAPAAPAPAPAAGSDLSSLRLVQVGGARLSEEAARRVRPVLGCALQQVFGMAEGLVNYTRVDDPDDVVATTQGLPISPDDELRIVDSAGRDVAAGQTGHLLTRGPYTIRGYYRAPEHNAVAFTADGFYRTGDLVRRTPTGHLVVEGRAKDQINRGGEKIAAEEVENHLLAHPAVRDAAVVAVPDDLLGERTCAVVIPRGKAPTPAQLRSFVRQRGVAAYKIPDRVTFVDEFPQTAVGKVDKGELRAALAAGLSPRQPIDSHTPLATEGQSA
jgi:2,3-dihydroxybenzoate-AMP ligase